MYTNQNFPKYYYKSCIIIIFLYQILHSFLIICIFKLPSFCISIIIMFNYFIELNISLSRANLSLIQQYLFSIFC